MNDTLHSSFDADFPNQPPKSPKFYENLNENNLISDLLTVGHLKKIDLDLGFFPNILNIGVYGSSAHMYDTVQCSCDAECPNQPPKSPKFQEKRNIKKCPDRLIDGWPFEKNRFGLGIFS